MAIINIIGNVIPNQQGSKLILKVPYNLDVPAGWLVPTEAEWNTERLSWSSNDRDGAFASLLKLPCGGALRYGETGIIENAGSEGSFWASTVNGIFSVRFYFSIDDIDINVFGRAGGQSIRLIKESGLPLVTGNQTFTYNGSSWTYQEVESEGRIWMDRNLGASQVASALDDALSYGDLFQWGRNIDGHQIRTSGTTTTLSTSDTPGHGDFILTSVAPYDWRDPQNNNLWQPI